MHVYSVQHVCSCVQCAACVCSLCTCVQYMHVQCAACVCMCAACVFVCIVCSLCACVQYMHVQCVHVCTLVLPTPQNMVVFLSVDAGNNIVRCRSISVGGAAGAGPGPSVQVGQHHGAPGAHLGWGWHPVEMAETESVLCDSWRCCPHAVCRPTGRQPSAQLWNCLAIVGSFPAPPGCSPSGHRQGPLPASSGVEEGEHCSGCRVPRKRIKSQPCPQLAGSQITWLCPQQDTELLASGFLSVKKTLNSVF